MNDKVKKLYDEIINEMTVAGAAGGAPDATSQGVFVWNKKGKGHKIRKSSPKLEEGFGGGFGGMAATNSGNSHQGYTGDFEKKVKNKIKELERPEKEDEENLEERYIFIGESDKKQQELVKQAVENSDEDTFKKAQEEGRQKLKTGVRDAWNAKQDAYEQHGENSDQFKKLNANFERLKKNYGVQTGLIKKK
jgi:hypothetical protein